MKLRDVVRALVGYTSQQSGFSAQTGAAELLTLNEAHARLMCVSRFRRAWDDLLN